MHPERVNNMKNLSASELSRRRLVPAKKSKAKLQQDPEPASEQTAEEIAAAADSAGEVATQSSGSKAAESSGSPAADA